MDSGSRTRNQGGNAPWRTIGWGAAALLLLLLLPLVAMQFSDDVNWTGSDFLFAAMLFGSVGIALELIVRKSKRPAYRCGAALAVVTAFLTVWVNAAVGMIGSENNPYNLLFIGVLFVALIGAILARFEPVGMMRAMAATAVAQALVGGAGLATDLRGAIFSIALAGLWLLSAAFFRNAAQDAILRGTAL